MGKRFSFFVTNKYYTVAGGDAGDKFWGAKVTKDNLNDSSQPLKFTVALKTGKSLHYTNQTNKDNLDNGGQVVQFLHQGKEYTLNAKKKITERAVIEKIEAELGDVTFVKKRGIDERWKNAEIIDVDAVDDDVTQPAKKKIKRQFITELFKELRF